jgi:hypothetical protein
MHLGTQGLRLLNLYRTNKDRMGSCFRGDGPPDPLQLCVLYLFERKHADPEGLPHISRLQCYHAVGSCRFRRYAAVLASSVCFRVFGACHGTCFLRGRVDAYLTCFSLRASGQIWKPELRALVWRKGKRGRSDGAHACRCPHRRQ